MTKLAIVTPSYIDSPKRENYAKLSLEQLREAGGDQFPHFVIDDIPRLKTHGFRLFLPNPKTVFSGTRIYSKPGIILRRRIAGSNTTALMKAMELAKEAGAEFAFIHLDDNVYSHELGPMLHHAEHAMTQNNSLHIMRLAGYPVMCGECTPEQGNTTLLTIEKDSVKFDEVDLKPTRNDDYTLWSTSLHERMVAGRYWPLGLWTAVYRIDSLLKIFKMRPYLRMKSLASVESFYRKKRHWRWLVKKIGGEIGYINMQYTGIEMDRNKNWPELLKYPNKKII